jgi:hypothetical protein
MTQMSPRECRMMAALVLHRPTSSPIWAALRANAIASPTKVSDTPTFYETTF